MLHEVSQHLVLLATLGILAPSKKSNNALNMFHKACLFQLNCTSYHILMHPRMTRVILSLLTNILTNDQTQKMHGRRQHYLSNEVVIGSKVPTENGHWPYFTTTGTPLIGKVLSQTPLGIFYCFGKKLQTFCITTLSTYCSFKAYLVSFYFAAHFYKS